MAQFEIVERPPRAAPPPAPPRAHPEAPASSPWPAIGRAALFAVASAAWFWLSVLKTYPEAFATETGRAFLPWAIGLTFVAELIGAVAIAFVVWVVSRRSALAAKVFLGALNAMAALNAVRVAASIPLALGAVVLAAIGTWMLFRRER